MIKRFIRQRTKIFHLAFSLLVILLLGIIDEVTGFEVSFAIFYVLPILYVTWYVGMRAAIVFSIISAITWHTSNFLAGEQHSNPLIPFWNAAMRLGFFMIIAYLFSSLKQSREHEKVLSRTDFLTGAWNLLGFYEKAGYEVERTRRYGNPITLLYFDIDDFKGINDRFSHSAGDAVLQTVVKTLQENLRAVDVISRMGGDEFAIMFPETGATAARVVAEKAQRFLLQKMQENHWPVTFSMGVVTFLSPPDSTQEFIKIADQLMYQAKFNGKNKIEYSIFSQSIE